MFIYKAALKMIICKWFRILLFIAAAGALVATFGVLGQNLLYSDIITEPITIIIADNDNSAESRMFTQSFIGYEPYKNIVNFSADTESRALDKIKASEAAAVLILPEGFAEHIKSGANEPFTVVLDSAQPLKKTLVEYFARSFSDILAASQSGVYAALDYTWQNRPDGYDRMFTLINLKFLNMVFNRYDMIGVKTVSAVNIPAFWHFAAAFWVFFNIAAGVLFFDTITSNFNPFILKKLRLANFNAVLFTLQLTFAFFTAFATINAVLLIPVLLFFPAPAVPFSLVTGAICVLICVSCLTVCLAFIIKNTNAACVICAALSLAGLFLSGGVIPREFFAARFYNIPRLTLNYWLYEAVTSAFTKTNSAATGMVALFSLGFFIISVLLVNKRPARF